VPWLIGPGLALIATVIARVFWLYRASLTWPTADGLIARIDIGRKSSGGLPSGHYFLPHLRTTSAIRVRTAFPASGTETA